MKRVHLLGYLYGTLGAMWFLSLTVQAGAESAQEKPKVFILQLKPLDVDEKKAMIIDGLLTSEVAKCDALEVVSGSDVQEMMNLEASKQEIGCTDEISCLAEVAGALGARYLIYGTVGQLGEKLVLNLNFRDVEEASSITRQTLTINKVDDVPELLARTTPDWLNRAGFNVRETTPAPSPAPSLAKKKSQKEIHTPTDALNNVDRVLREGPKSTEALWQWGWTGAGALIGGAALYYDFTAVTSRDDKLQPQDWVGPAGVVVGASMVALPLLVNPFKGPSNEP